MLKKILGVLFFLFGIICILSIIGNVLRLIIGEKEAVNNQATVIIAIIFCVILGFFFFKYSIKWMRRKKVDQDKIEDIGN